MKKISILFLTVFISLAGFSQDSVKTANKWGFLVEPYLMFPTMSGTAGLGSLPDVPVEANPGDIFSHLQMGAMLTVEASNAKWAINSDLMYMKLKQDATPGTRIKSGTVTAKQLGWELAGLYRLNRWLEVGAGTLLTSIDGEVNVTVNNIGGSTTDKNKSGSKTWVDPMLIARVQSKAGEKFIYSLRGEIGGFGIGSDFTWQVQAYAGYRFSKLFQMTGGYRVIGINYNKGTGEDRFLYDMDTFGPVVRFGFNF